VFALVAFIAGTFSFPALASVEFVLDLIVGFNVVGFFLAYLIACVVVEQPRVDEVLSRAATVVSYVPSLLAFIPSAVFVSQGGSGGLSWGAMSIILGAEVVCPLAGGLMTLASVVIEASRGSPQTVTA
jgi:hypothetical protein